MGNKLRGPAVLLPLAAGDRIFWVVARVVVVVVVVVAVYVSRFRSQLVFLVESETRAPSACCAPRRASKRDHPVVAPDTYSCVCVSLCVRERCETF